MVQPGNVDVLHTHDGDVSAQRTWIADGHVFIDVTGSSAVDGLDDGWYRIVMTKGLVSRDGIPRFNMPILLSEWRGMKFYPACPTRWAPFVSEAKAMLFFVEIPPSGTADGAVRMPLAINAGVWSAMFDAYGTGLRVWHAGYGGPFKFTTPDNTELAYVYPVTIPDDLRTEAIALTEVCRWPDSMRNAE